MVQTVQTVQAVQIEKRFMRSTRWLHNWTFALGLAFSAAAAFAQDRPADNDYQPTVGQAGKDVIWVPTAQSLIDKMLDVARVRANDFVIDLGSGDGRTVITAAKRGARARGIEYNPDMVDLSTRNARNEGVSERTEFVKADIFESDFSNATVITMFLLTEINLKLRPKILDLRPGTRIVSNTFTMGAWTADQIVIAENDCEHYCVAHFWIVPAKVEGRWQLGRSDLNLKQSFQMISGTLKTDGGVVEIANGRLEGVRLSFTAGDTEYLGYVNGDRMEGIARGLSGSADWTATALERR
jgi:precorrin-6B methylase 2